jgi:murein DD-endopeptidase / murein LD-carboxypeptidase
MSRRGLEMAARARALVGTPYRPQGRDPRFGLDCVGTAAAAAGLAGDEVRRNYGLRGQRLAEIEHELCEFGWLPVPGEETAPGDVIVCQTGPAQFHLAVALVKSFVHADAGLRRVVERPMPLPWPVEGIWRRAEDLEGDE